MRFFFKRRKLNDSRQGLTTSISYIPPTTHCSRSPLCFRKLFPFGIDCTLTAEPTHSRLNRYTCAVSDLTDFIVGNAGKRFFTAPKVGNENWDRVIHDLTRFTAEQCTSYLGGGKTGKGQQRGVSVNEVLCFFSGELEEKSFIAAKAPRLKQHSDTLAIENGALPELNTNAKLLSIIEFVIETDPDLIRTQARI